MAAQPTTPAMQQRIRKRIEEAFGWMKTVGGQRKTQFRGVERAISSFAFAAAAYNLIRVPKLIEARAAARRRSVLRLP